jgi:hypothetical protein
MLVTVLTDPFTAPLTARVAVLTGSDPSGEAGKVAIGAVEGEGDGIVRTAQGKGQIRVGRSWRASVYEARPGLREGTDDVIRFTGEVTSCTLFATFGYSRALVSGRQP